MRARAPGIVLIVALIAVGGVVVQRARTETKTAVSVQTGSPAPSHERSCPTSESESSYHKPGSIDPNPLVAPYEKALWLTEDYVQAGLSLPLRGSTKSPTLSLADALNDDPARNQSTTDPSGVLPDHHDAVKHLFTLVDNDRNWIKNNTAALLATTMTGQALSYYDGILSGVIDGQKSTRIMVAGAGSCLETIDSFALHGSTAHIQAPFGEWEVFVEDRAGTLIWHRGQTDMTVSADVLRMPDGSWRVDKLVRTSPLRD